MAATKELIKRIRLTASAASITFYNIPQDFDGLELVVSARTDRASEIVEGQIQFNGSGSNFTVRDLIATIPTGVGSDPFTYGRVGLFNCNNATANTFSSTSIFIPNYASNNYKSFSSESTCETNATSSYFANILAGLWSQTAPIQSVTIFPSLSAKFLPYTSAALYGYKKGSDGITSVG